MFFEKPIQGILEMKANDSEEKKALKFFIDFTEKNKDTLGGTIAHVLDVKNKYTFNKASRKDVRDKLKDLKGSTRDKDWESKEYEVLCDPLIVDAQTFFNEYNDFKNTVTFYIVRLIYADNNEVLKAVFNQKCFDRQELIANFIKEMKTIFGM